MYFYSFSAYYAFLWRTLAPICLILIYFSPLFYAVGEVIPGYILCRSADFISLHPH